MKTALVLKELSVAVEEKILLKQVSLTIPASEGHALLGPNGCGKLTLIIKTLRLTMPKRTR